jgi:hypothetical protein
VKLTVAPETALPKASLTTTTRGAAKAAPMKALCGVPLTTVTEAGAPAVLVNSKVAVKAPTVAVTLYGPPATVFAVAVRETWPEALVMAVPLKVAEAPAAGVVKLTVTPGNATPPALRTTATSDCAKAVFTTVDCGVPLTTVMLAGTVEMLVRSNVAEVAPPTAAVTEYEPAVPLAVAVTWVCPAAFVTAAAVRPAEAPAPGAAKLTVAPGTTFPKASFTTTTRGAAKAAPVKAL